MIIHFSVGYDPESPLVRECDLRIDEGRVTSIVGDNGCGKSTVYRTLAGEVPPLSGAVPGDLPGRCCTVSDRSKIPGEVLVGDIVDLVGKTGMARPRSRSRMVADVVEGLSGTRVSRLSTGQRRLLEIGVCLSTGRDVLMLDEALSGLDYRSRQACIDAVLALEGTTVLATSHNLEDVLALGGRILFLDAEERALVEYPGERTVEALRAFMTERMETRGDDALEGDTAVRTAEDVARPHGARPCARSRHPPRDVRDALRPVRDAERARAAGRGGARLPLGALAVRLHRTRDHLLLRFRPRLRRDVALLRPGGRGPSPCRPCAARTPLAVLRHRCGGDVP